jgi:hypothetical protein
MDEKASWDHRFDGLDLRLYHSHNFGDGFPLTEGLVLYMCVKNDCNTTWQAYMGTNVWLRDTYEYAGRYGDRLQRDYLPSYAGYMAAPLAAATLGHGEIRVSHNEVFVLDLKHDTLAYRYEF